MSILQSIRVCYNLYMYTIICVYATISLCMLQFLGVCYNFYLYATISMCMLQSVCVCYNLFVHQTGPENVENTQFQFLPCVLGFTVRTCSPLFCPSWTG